MSLIDSINNLDNKGTLLVRCNKSDYEQFADIVSPFGLEMERDYDILDKIFLEDGCYKYLFYRSQDGYLSGQYIFRIGEGSLKDKPILDFSQELRIEKIDKIKCKLNGR